MLGNKLTGYDYGVIVGHVYMKGSVWAEFVSMDYTFYGRTEDEKEKLSYIKEILEMLKLEVYIRCHEDSTSTLYVFDEEFVKLVGDMVYGEGYNQFYCGHGVCVEIEKTTKNMIEKAKEDKLFLEGLEESLPIEVTEGVRRFVE